MRTILPACLSALVLAACGIKGPLYMPKPIPAPTSPAPAAAQPDTNKTAPTTAPAKP